MKRPLVAFASGALFSAGLCLAGMTRPQNVIAFLDVSGAWNPSLAFVMVGAIAVSAVAFRVVARRSAPTLDDRFHIPVANEVDAGLVLGAALFGVGWGLSGVCPGPAIASLAAGETGAFVFFGAMVAGVAAHHLFKRLFGRSAPNPSAAHTGRVRPPPISGEGRPHLG